MKSEPNIHYEQISSNKSIEKNKSKSLDKRHIVGKQFQVTCLHLFMRNGIIPNNVAGGEQFQFSISPDCLKDFELEGKIDYQKEECKAEALIKQTLQNKLKFSYSQRLDAEIDITPHQRTDKTYSQIIQIIKNSQPIQIHQNIFGLKVQADPNKIIYSGQIKRNVFNKHQRKMKCFPKEANSWDVKKKIGLYRTVELMRKIIALRRWQLQYFNKSHYEKLVDITKSHLRSRLVNKNFIYQTLQQFTEKNLKEKQIVFFLCFKSSQVGKNFFQDNLGQQNFKFLQKFCRKNNVLLNLIVVISQDEIDLMKQQINLMKNQMKGMKEEIKQVREEVKQVKKEVKQIKDQISNINYMIITLNQKFDQLAKNLKKQQ